MLFLSSGMVYDRPHSRPRIPETRFGEHVPSDPYGFSKYLCAQSIAAYGNVFELRLFGVFGPHEDWRVRFISNACCRAVWDMPVTLRQNVFFDYLDVEDLGRLLEAFLNRELRPPPLQRLHRPRLRPADARRKSSAGVGETARNRGLEPRLGSGIQRRQRPHARGDPRVSSSATWTIPSSGSTAGMRSASPSSMPACCVSMAKKVDPMTTPSRQPSGSLDDLLTGLRSETRDRIPARVHQTWLRLAGPSPTGLVVFGCGQLGRFVLPGVRAAGLFPLAFSRQQPAHLGNRDRRRAGAGPGRGRPERFGATVPFLVAIYNASPVRRQLAELGCRWIVPYPAFFWEHSACLPAEERLDLPQRIVGHLAEIEAAYELLDDDRSRREYLAQIRWRCLLDYDCLPARDRPADMYFPPDLVSLSGSEVLVDCGAFDGDSIRLFLEKTAGRFARIHAFEPDAGNIASLSAYLGTLPEETAARIEVQRCALGRENGVVRFSAEGTVGSKVSGAGMVEIPCRTLDSALAGCVPTIVKMDIEGAEIDAIPGAARIAVECRPIIAACAYHHCSDLWTLPGLLKAANPEYRVFLRRYAEECWETVYYAIPPERLGGLTPPRQSPEAEV